MSNRFGIPAEIERELRARDKRCVYCGRRFSRLVRKRMPTIEHLDERPPFYWELGLRKSGLVICCVSCNCSRGRKTLRAWFAGAHCEERGIKASTVAAPVKAYLRSRRRQT
jgi:hypothetical protein